VGLTQSSVICAYKLVFGLTDLNLNDYDIVDININYSYQAADPTPDITFSLTVQEEYGITCQVTILTFLI